MSKKAKKNVKPRVTGFTFVREAQGVFEYKLVANDLTVLIDERPGTEVITSNITYKVGARDEITGESGLAHMLEHMLFKPTKNDIKNKIDSGAMKFERDTGCILNANTWKDRTTYFFSYPKEYFSKAIAIEADRMNNVVLSDKEFLPERGNVLSEFDMYFGDPYFALDKTMISTAFHSHPYGHETIGHREDIENYTVEKLKMFYEKYYQPSNATLTISGDIQTKEALNIVKDSFSAIKNTQTINKAYPLEPKQEGIRRDTVRRDSTMNIISIGFKHAGFPSHEWFAVSTFLSVLADGPDSILHRQLIDSNLASRVSYSLEPGSDTNLATISITLVEGSKHEEIENKVLTTIRNLNKQDINKSVKKVFAKTLTEEVLTHSSSLGFAMELTEYIAADDWTKYFDTEKMLKSLNVKEVLEVKKLFADDNLTIGRFIGTA